MSEYPKENGKSLEYQCGVCSYIYEPDSGDATSGVPPGTPWEMLPDQWGCPHCGASKAVFSALES